MLVFHRRQLEQIPAKFVAHYNRHPPHRSLARHAPLGVSKTPLLISDPDPATSSERHPRRTRQGVLADVVNWPDGLLGTDTDITWVVGKDAVTRGNSLDREPVSDLLVLLLGVGQGMPRVDLEGLTGLMD
jgi:hypothetical protein